MALPDPVIELIERFERNRASYMAGGYNETQLRNEFLNPLFEALGWDVLNKQGYAEAYKDVIHEDAIKVGGFTKAPDYCFRIGGTRKFFVEAKKPSVNVKDDTSPAFQLRRYAWSAKLPLSILSDFEEFAVYDCRIKPIKTDKASTARILYTKFEEYPNKWDEIASVFARDSILKGSFDRYVETTKGKKGTAEVDAAFLKEIEAWRNSLARNLALRNPGLSQRELNYAVQTLIDRIIFLRMCEDRGIEAYGRLMALQNGNKVYERMFELFQRADDRYNSGLFHFREEKGRNEAADQLTPSLNIEDKPLKDIIKNLYYPDSPYEFAVLPADILGHVYEQFLGKVIRLTAGHHAVVEDKPEVKKAGGVYYTPTYIVDYIVENTVGKLLEGKTPKQASKIRILDPACGSGSFLIGAYQRLMDWHRDRYVEDGTGKHTKEIYQGSGGEWRLTTAERKRILLNNIFGVDIDPQAVEVTKLSLLLKVLEGESDETLSMQLKLFHERALPVLSENIKCGNSLIGPDFYDNQQLALLDEEDRYRINAFDWNAEFSDITKGGGFDAVIGNPPYIRMEAFKDIKEYLKLHYAVHSSRSDIYAYFVEKAHELLRPTGLFGMILSNKFVKAEYGKTLREFLLHISNIRSIIDLGGLNIFVNATIRPLVIITERISQQAPQDIETSFLDRLPAEVFRQITGGSLSLSQAEDKDGLKLPSGAFTPNRWMLIDSSRLSVLSKIERTSVPLRTIVNDQVLWGVKTGLNNAFVIDGQRRNEIVSREPASSEIIKPFLFGEDVRRYKTNFAHRFLIYTYHGINIDRYDAVREHLLPFKKQLEARATKQAWYELQQPSVALVPIFESPKIVYPEIASECRFTIDSQGYYSNNKTFILPTADPCLLALLNSRIALFYFGAMCAALESGSAHYMEFRALYVREFPVPGAVQANTTDISVRNTLIRNAEAMLRLNESLAEAKTPKAQAVLRRQIEATDRKIDQLAYELYDLTDGEIAIVERETE